MDAKRYEQIQQLFWEIEELRPAEQEPSLRARAGDDLELVNEVLSLLREHDPAAARAEGHNAQPVRMPETKQTEPHGIGKPGSMRGPKKEKASPLSTKKGIQGRDPLSGQRTSSGAQRTHAAPRFPKSSRPTGRSPKTAETPSQSTLLTSIGPPRRRGTWLPLWLAISVAAILPSWLAAWSFGNAQIQRQREARQVLLPLAINQARLEIQSLLDADRWQLQRDADDQRLRSLIDNSLVEGHGAKGQQEMDAAFDAIIATMTGRANKTANWVLWDQEFRILGATTNAADPIPKWNARYAGSVAQCLAGEAVFIGPESTPLRQESPHASPPSQDVADQGPIKPKLQDIGYGWMVPLWAAASDASNPPQDESPHDRSDRPIGVLMRTGAGLWPQINSALRAISAATNLDVYVVDRQGRMQTHGKWLDSVAKTNDTNDNQVGRFRVAEYRENLDRGNVYRSVQPLTIASASVTANPVLTASPVVTVHPTAYANYWGGHSAGAWIWLPNYNLGLIVEAPVQPAETPLSLTWPWAAWASLFAVAVASAVVCWHRANVAIITDARQALGRYEIQRELGSGGMGIVYLARHRELGREIALKVLRSDRQDQDDRQRFDREARLAASLSCPHSVTIFDFGYTAQGNAFCVMELLSGLTLAEVVARGGPQSPGRVIWIMQQICQSMLEAHSKGLMHRDLKPQNVMLRLDNVAGDWATVFDFGLAKSIEPDQDVFQTSETIWAGTPMYMAPERFRDPTSMDPRSDIYSIGCIAYYLLAGNPPFVECDPESMFALIMSEHPLSISTHRSDSIDGRLENWVQVCMRKDNHTRAADIPELIRSLQAMASDMAWSRSDAEAWWSAHASELQGR